MLRWLSVGFACCLVASGVLRAEVETSAIDRLYAGHPAPVWLSQQQLNQHGRQALNFIAQAEAHGLNPQRYHHAQLQRLHQHLDVDNALEYDALLSQALLKLLEDLARGVMDPAQADPDWAIHRDAFDAVGFITSALQAEDFAQALTQAAPSHIHYQGLKQALKYYRQLASQQSWPQVPLTETLRSGDQHADVPLLRRRLLAEMPELAIDADSELYDNALAEAIRKFQKRYSLKVDGITGRQTLAAMNVPIQQRIEQIRLNLERHRWLPHDPGQRYIMVNLAGFQLIAVENNDIKLNMRVIVGQLKRSTPSFATEMTHIVFNPFWHVPPRLARLDVLPRQQADPQYLYAHGFQVFEQLGSERQEVAISAVDWQQYSRHYFPYSLRQRPGPLNALGTMKFMFPNPWNIYLHDTPHRNLFDETERNFSSGCIRVEDPYGLAAFSLNENGAEDVIQRLVDSRRNSGRTLQQKVPVYAVYFTVWPEQGEIRFALDHYRRDQRMAKFLDSGL